MVGWIRRLWLFFKRGEEKGTEIPTEEPKRSFFSYIGRTPQIVTYFRREKGIARRDLELVLIDNEEQPAYQILEITELLAADLKLLYIVTERPEVFEEFADEAMEEQGLLVVVLENIENDRIPGNLVLDTCDWEKHLDIISALSYNTIIA